jgi:hypothetical protein
MFAVFFGAVAVNRQRVISDLEAAFESNLVLALLDFRIVKLFHAAAIQANQMVMMRAFIQLENRLSGLEMVTVQQRACSNCVKTRYTVASPTSMFSVSRIL